MGWMTAPLLGQFLALLCALMSVLTKTLVLSFGISSPALQNSIGYGVTCILVLPRSAVHWGVGERISFRRLAVLFIIALADSQASFISNLAFRYGVSVASVGMLSSFTVPCVMVLSSIFLNVEYHATHYLGILVAMIGMFCVCLADAAPTGAASSGTGNYGEIFIEPIIGDILVLIASAVYAVSNVFSEGYIKAQSTFEYLFWIGLFGSLISFAQFAIVELPYHRNNRILPGGSKVEACVAAYALVFSMVYFISAKFLEVYDAVLFNLSLLTTGLWGLLFGHLLFAESIHPLKILGFAAVVVGITVYQKSQELHQRTAVKLEEIPLVAAGDV